MEDIDKLQNDYVETLWYSSRFLACCHIVMSLIGLLAYSTKRMYIGIIFNILSFPLSVMGLLGIQSCNRLHIKIYAVATCSIFGALISYEILTYAFIKDNDSEAPSQQMVLLIMTIPYLVDFASGIRSFQLILYLMQNKLEIYVENDVLKVYCQEKEQFLGLPQDKYCVVCIRNEINTVFYRCGHRAVCMMCYQKLKNHGKRNCPVCRQVIDDCIIQYNV